MEVKQLSEVLNRKMNKENQNVDYENQQTIYAEKYGIIESKLVGSEMIFYTSHPAAYKPDQVTYKVTVDLDKLKEKERKKLKKYYKKGEVNLYL